MKHILIYEPQADHDRRLAFVLSLAGHKHTFTRSIDELINWLTLSDNLEDPFDLILLYSLPDPTLLGQLQQVCTLHKQLPIICLRDKGASLTLERTAGINYCNPENLVGTLLKHLAAGVMHNSRPGTELRQNEQ